MVISLLYMSKELIWDTNTVYLYNNLIHTYLMAARLNLLTHKAPKKIAANNILIFYFFISEENKA